MVSQGEMEYKDLLVKMEKLEKGVLLDYRVEGSPTQGGGRALVQGTELVYSGITGGTLYCQEGGGANYLCMPKDPEYSNVLTYTSGEEVCVGGRV